MTVLMKVSDYAIFRGVSRRQVYLWIEKGAVTVRRLAPRTGVRIVVPVDEVHDVLLTEAQVRHIAPDPDIR